jgi:hypothetical protein
VADPESASQIKSATLAASIDPPNALNQIVAVAQQRLGAQRVLARGRSACIPRSGLLHSDFVLCRVGPGNFTLSLSQIRT